MLFGLFIQIMQIMKPMQMIFLRILHCCRCLSVLVLLLPALAVRAVADNSSCTMLPSSCPVSYRLYSTAERAQNVRSTFSYGASLPSGLPFSSVSVSRMGSKPLSSLSPVASAPASRIRLSEIGSATPYTPSDAGGESRRPFRVSDNDNIGDPGATPVGEVPFALMLLLCGVWMLLRRRKTA